MARSSSSRAPLVIRWRNDMLNDPRVLWQGRLAGMALTIYAKAQTGKDCYPSAQQCAEKMGVGVSTIERGWKQLKDAGWLEIKQLPPGTTRRGGSRSALKVLTWPKRTVDADDRPTTTSGQKCWQCGARSLRPKLHQGEDTGLLECGQCGAANEPQDDILAGARPD